MYFGFVRVAAAVPQLKVADCAYNIKKIISLVQQAESEKAQVVCFPELCITGYSCEDLFFQQQLLNEAEKALSELMMETFSNSCVVIVGMPVRTSNKLFNAAVIIQGGKILGVVPKTFIPNYGEFYEKRWFAPADDQMQTITISGHTVPFGTKLLFTDKAFTFAIELCEDYWMASPPSAQHTMHGAEVVFNLSASNEIVGKAAYRRQIVTQFSGRTAAGYVYASCGVHESTTNTVFSGAAFITEGGKMLSESERFSFDSQLIVNDIDIERLRLKRMKNNNYEFVKSNETYRTIVFEEAHYKQFTLKRKYQKLPFLPSDDLRNDNCHDVFAIQTHGLAKRWKHTNAHSLVIGISGGLDSTLALLVCVKTADLLGYDRKRVIGITMPGFGTSSRTYNNSIELMKALGITSKEISIKDACIQHFKDINHNLEVQDVTYENSQARERTQILMDIANQQNGFVVGTGNMSELALGWCTYNGDHMSMYAVNTGVPKTLVRYLVCWISEQMDDNTGKILSDVLDTPVSPELLPTDNKGNISQKTEDIVGPYELHDFFMYHFIQYGFTPKKLYFLAKHTFWGDYSEEDIKKWLKVFLRRFFSQQFKRSCMPDGPKIGSVNLSPRADWRMPSDAVAFELDED